MPFLTEDDYNQIPDFDLDDITNYRESLRTDTEIRAQEQMEEYLTDRYDTGQIFGAVGVDRNPLVVMYMIDIVLYHLFSTAPFGIPEVRKDRFRDAKIWLSNLREGALNPKLPVKEDAQGKRIIASVFSSAPKNGYHW